MVLDFATGYWVQVKVLVTGASGFIGAWVCKTLLEKGYHVVGTVRSPAKGAYLERLFEKDGLGKDHFSFVIVDDIEKEGAFDQAVVGVDAVEHTASPVTLSHAGDPQEIIQPAVRGTIGILESIKKHAPGVKRVVMTSSYAAVITPKAPLPGQEFGTIDESDWNILSANEIEQKGQSAGGVHIYRASKVLAERAAWDFVEKNKASIGFDLVTVLPPMVYGPGIHEVTTSPGTSLDVFRDNVLLASKTEEELLAPVNVSGYWADVRDVAAVHVLSLASPRAGGERFLTASGPDSWQNFLDAIHTSQRDVTDVPKGYPGKGHNPKVPARVIATKAENLLNFKFRTVEDTIPATFRYIREKGF
ncbi:methylglyoxal reductase (NADPH-dependent) gre2 [Tulasnella sp. JGI-2019a]|nr:methylglyoxal reductase (NADPH-dependent) gre2 [Tulasnella sp. JGI-2019a]